MNYKRLDLGITKTYLVPCDNGFLLIDTGYETDYGKFRKKLEKVGVDISRIKYILLTHYHDDHSGFANKLKYEFGIPLIVQKKSVSLLADGDSGEEEGGEYVTKRMKFLFSVFEKFHKSFQYPPVLVNGEDIIVDGDDQSALRKIGIAADILFTPGHSADSMSVLCDDGTAFVGDAAMNYLKFTGTHYRPIYYIDLKAVYKSIRKLLSAGAKTIVPAHGNAFSADKLTKMIKRFD